MLKAYAYVVTFCLSFSICMASATEKIEEDSLKPFSDVGLGFRTGGAFIEKPTAKKFQSSLALGAEVEVAILSFDHTHYLMLPVGYVHPTPSLRQGTEQLEVETIYQLVDVGIEYDYKWMFFSIGLGAGASMMVVSSKVTLFDLNEPELEMNSSVEFSEAAYTFPNKTSESSMREVGLETGPYVNLEFGFDLGKVVGEVAGAEEKFVELKAVFQYARRQVRNELYCWATLSFIPTVFLYK